MAGRPRKTTEYREVFAGKKLGKQIEKCNNAYELNNLWEQYISTAELERNARLINNDEIVEGCILFMKKIDSVCDFSLDTAQFTTYKELRNKVEIKKLNLLIQGRGGKKASRTRKVNKEKPIEKKDDTVYSDWVELNYHPFSVNYQYDYIDGRKIRSRAYQNWLGGFPTAFCPDEIDLLMEGVDVHKPVGISIEVICMPHFDCDNFTKSLIDVIYSRVFSEEGLNDNLVWESRIKKIGECKDYSEGVIRYRFYNI